MCWFDLTWQTVKSTGWVMSSEVMGKSTVQYGGGNRHGMQSARQPGQSYARYHQSSATRQAMTQPRGRPGSSSLLRPNAAECGTYLQWLATKGRGKGSIIKFTKDIVACTRRGDWRRALTLFRQMLSVSQKPDVVCYSAVISGCEKGMQWDEALRLLQQMTCRALTPNEISYNAALTVCGRAG